MNPRAGELSALLLGSAWFRHVLEVVAWVDPPQWLVGAGAVRDLVWSERFGDGFDPSTVADVDVVFFDGDDLLDGVWRRNPVRVTTARYRERLAAKRPAKRWPGVRVL